MSIIKPSYSTGYAKNASQSAHPNLWDGLVGAWMPSLGVTGETLRDVSGNGNHGTLTNMDAATDWVGTSKGLALDFDGSSDTIQTNRSTNSFYGQSNSVTFSCVFRADLIHQGGLIATDGSNRFYIETFNRSGQMVAHWGFGAAQNYPQTQALISSNRWYNYTATYDGSVAKGYLDGVETDSQVIGSQTFSGNVFLASFGSRLYFNGKINSWHIYNRALSPQEIKQLYVDSLAPFRRKQRVSVAVPAAIPAATVVGSIKKPTTIIKPSYQAGYARNASESENPQLWDGLVGAWMPSLGVTGETLRDVSGNGNHGTLTNMGGSNWEPSYLNYAGTNQSVLVDSIEERQSGEPRTVCAWFRGNYQPNNYHVITGQWYNNQQNFGIWIRDRENIDFFVGGSIYIDGSISLTGKWQFAAISIEGGSTGNVKTYIDAKQTAQFNRGTLNETGTQDWSIGCRTGITNDRFFVGDIGSVVLHNRALSPSEIKQLYVDSLAPFRKKQRVSVAVPAAVAPTATYHPLRSLAHPLEQ